MSDNNVISINVHDEVGTVDVGPGGPPAPAPEPLPELIGQYVAPHSLPGRVVTAEDVGRVVEEAAMMHRLCLSPAGMYPSALALAHTQVEKDEPLRFFVTVAGEIIVNPYIVNHSGTTVDNKEGCMSFPVDEPKTVQRWNVVELKFQTVLKDGTLSDPQVKTFSGKISKIIQHETAHLNGKCIYDESISAEDCLN